MPPTKTSLSKTGAALPQNRLIPIALQSFRRIGAPLGLKLGMFSATLLACQENPGAVELRLADGERVLLLKWVERPEQARGLVASAVAQETAREALWGFPDLKVPKVLAQNLSERAVLTEEAQGTPLEIQMIEGGNAAESIGRAASWLAAFHRETFAEDRLFQPAFVQSHIARMVEEVGKHPDSIPAASEFLAHAATLMEQAAPVQDHPVKSAQSHGEMTLRNILIAGSQTSVINFRPLTKAPGTFDVARALSDVLQIILPVSGERTSIALPDGLQTAFFTAYPQITPDDRLLGLMLRVRILAEWRAIPAKPAARSWRQDRRWAFIRSLGPKVFNI